MMKFRSQYESHDRIYQPEGDPVKTLYGPIFDKQGHMELQEIGQENLYDYIQSHADSVDIHVILKQFEQGDVSVLSRVQGAYGDFTQMPKTFAEALNTLIAAEQYFNGLPVEVRAQFGHNFNQFIASMDQPDFSSRMGIAPEVPPEAPQTSSASSPAQTATPASSDSPAAPTPS